MITPRDYQTASVASLFDYFTHSNGSPLIVLPTGSGKSFVMALLCYEILKRYPNERLLILSHDSRIIQQNVEELRGFWTKAPCGVFSASLGSREFRQPIVFATVQSVFRKAHLLGNRSLCFIDEAHLLSRKDDGMYNILIAELRKINSRMKIIGLTASPFRLDSGLLTEGDDRIFTDICHEVKLSELLKCGYVCPLISRPSKVKADLSKVGVVGGEFNSRDLETVYDDGDRIERLLDESIPLLTGRRSILVFCTGIKHSDHMRDALRRRGIQAESVSSKTPKDEQRRLLEDFKNQKLRALCSVGMLAVGFNAKCVDAILMDRSTLSPGLLLQIAGRGMRLFPGKANCIFLDAGKNLERLGPITHLSVPKRRRGKGDPADSAPKVRICDLCRTAHPLGTIECSECGNIMVKERDATTKLDSKPADVEIMMSDEEYLEKSTAWADVTAVKYRRHRKDGKPDSLRVDYECGMMTYKEWVCLFHEGFAGRKAAIWWQKRSDGPIPASIEAALEASGTLKQPARIRIRKNHQHFEVLDYEFGSPRQAGLAIGA